MTITSKREVARILRNEAKSIRRHGFTNFFSHQFACLLGQTLRPEQCEGCLLGDYVPEEVRQEAFPCQHIDPGTWDRVAQIPGLPQKVADRFDEIAEELETEGGTQDTRPAARRTQQR